MFTYSKNIFKQGKSKTITIIKAKEAQTKPRLDGSQRLKECGLILGLLIAILMMVSLFSFNPADPSWSQTAWGGSVHNAGGYIGSWLADTLFFTFGVFAYPLPFIILGASWAFFRSRDENEGIDLLLWGTRLLGLVIVLLTSCGLADINFDDIWYFSSGGVIGDVLTSIATPALNILGSTLVFMFLWGAGFTLLTGISWLSIVEHLGQAALKFSQRLFNRARHNEPTTLSANQYQQAELSQIQVSGVEEDSLMLKSHVNSDLDESDSVPHISTENLDLDEGVQAPQQKKPRFNIHFPRKAAKVARSSVADSSAFELTEEEKNDPLFSDSSTATPTVTPYTEEVKTPVTSANSSRLDTVPAERVTETQHSEAIQGFDRYQNPNATIAELDQQAVSENDFVEQYQDNVSAKTGAESNCSTEPSATQTADSITTTSKTSSSVIGDVDIEEKAQPSLGQLDDLLDDEVTPAVHSNHVSHSEHAQPVVAQSEAVHQQQTAHQQQTVHQQEIAHQQPNLMQQNPQEQPAANSSTHQSESSVPASAQPVTQAQHEAIKPAQEPEQGTSPLPEEANALAATSSPDHSDQDAVAFQNMVAAAQVNALASQNPFLVQNDVNLPTPTAPMPTLELLYHPEKRENNIDRDALEEIARLVESKLADYKIEARVVDIFPGPVITRFELDLAPGVKVSRISGLSMDLARSLSAMAVRVVEVIPGKPYVGLELPNMTRETVYLSDVISSEAFQNNKSPTAVVLGQDIAGEAVVADLAKMPHVLVAGTTGSGKSVGVNVMILSMLYKATPEEVRFIMIDPKMLELSIYEGIPHLLSEVVTDMKDASNALRWCVGEMERRYKLMSAVGVRNLKGYNEKLKMAAEAGHPIHDPLWQPGDSMDEMPPRLEKLPYIVVIVDEFADLIMVVGKKVEELIARLAQKARAAGIHLVLATQRPSVDVITGLIKANIPTRVAFTVSTKTDSRTILDQGGAESLLGMGDMLYLPPGSNHTIRVHGAFASDDDVHAVVNDWKARGKPVYIDEIVHGEPTADSLLPGEQLESEEEVDPLYDQVVEFVTESRRGSVSGVQRRFKIGYNRAARIVEQLEAQGIVSTPGHNGNREVIAPPPIKQFD